MGYRRNLTISVSEELAAQLREHKGEMGDMIEKAFVLLSKAIKCECGVIYRVGRENCPECGKSWVAKSYSD